MIYEVTITEQANADLRKIYEYIAFELLSPDNAAGQLDRLEENIIGLEQFPEKYRAYDKEPWHSRGMRVMSVDNYLVFYILDKDAGLVTVIRVMYEGRDIEAQLNNHTKM
ncbi:MAG: type II toxin-antitoxin system RelE/ParE family toxin [Lachnospiraceae bacterium]|nr:type II toxin-antitoxin system RelE/ParE family toxin [Lachnospiraceae bacterium]